MKTAHHRGFVAKHQTQAGERNVFVVAAIIVIALILTGIAEAAESKPNVVFILADNVGYGDLGAYGGGESRIGQYGDKMMEGDQHVGAILDALKEAGVDDNTLVVFASDNGPQGETSREMGNQGTPDMGNAGPFRGELGEATEGSIRTFCMMRWPGKIKPGTRSYAMFSTMDFFPTFAQLIGAKVPTDRPINGVDQTDVLLGENATGHRDSLLTFIGAGLVAVRWKQWRMYFTDVHPTGEGPQRDPGMFSASSPMAGYPKIYNIEMDPHEDLQVGALFGWSAGRPLEEVKKYLESLKKYPNPPAGNLTKF